MISAVLLIYLLLFSLGCGGILSLGLLYHCLRSKILKTLMVVFTLLLLSLLNNILGTYFLEIYGKLPYPPWIGTIISLLLVLSLYGSLFNLLRNLRNVGFYKAFFPTIVVIVIQILRVVLFYFLSKDIQESFYLPAMVFLSAYIFYIGLSLTQGIDPLWHYSLKKIVKTLGITTLIFSPASMVFYLTWFILGMREKMIVSLDFIFLGVWSTASIGVLIQYLARMGHLPQIKEPSERLMSSLELTKREKEVLKLLIQGFTNKEIGEKLFISLVTARTHVSHIFAKTKVRNRVELAAKISGAMVEEER